ncbi:membrane-bound transcriptional regulator LytR [Gracilibacillus halophilus YIM-C55.5]|uniref:Membrane-bound transcriptional regulator LytR n=1 Tax=Gracilibacillus halophilus YIM-C55.5 TaxID=1308866 RepID=N4W7I7_9BACI|nr:LCP family protein [Gracilibacillus halophilus]ENH96233.1 membrane-bound transcriptional regulator LytR [Gracilibacillus halophilus YIM-C55.5]
MEKRKDQKKKRSKLWWAVVIGSSVIGVLILSVIAYMYSVYRDVQNTVDMEVHEEVENIDTEKTKEKVENQEPLNILLLGVDEREGDSGRSDALMVLSLNPANDAMQLVSIPRDTRTELVGRGTQDKINHAYAFGGVDMSINTVENFLDVELDYFVRMNMEGLTDMVDAIGGITVNNQLDWVDKGYYKQGYHYEEGEIELNGPKTMGYVRMRYQDPNGDFGRTQRQRQVIKAVIDKGASFNSVGKINEMLDVVGQNVVTNMEFKDMRDLFMNYRKTRNNFTSYMMQGNGTRIDGTYYLLVGDDEVEKVHKMIEKTES